MGKKRPNEEPNTVAKKAKMIEFNGTLFKNMLKDPTTAMKGLQTFISTAKKLPSSELYDVVEGYIKISMECAEIFKLLEGEKQIEREMVLIFESLEMILLRTASDLSHFNMVGNAIVKKTVSSHMKLIQGCFHSENHRLVRQCLSLLSASISQGPEAAREILSHIYFNKSLAGLARRKDKKGGPDIRMAFIQFALSFLVSGDSATVGQILEVKELLPEILSTGLKDDRLSIVNLILSTLKTRVVLNKAISKTQKVRFFTAALLAHIASLYKWNGIVDVTVDEDEMADDSENAGISVVREMAHNFLLELCCSRKYGISFHDASYGTAGRAGNIVLLQFLVGLKQATEDELLAELLVRTLNASPDVLTRYFKETQYSYSPRLTSAWQDNVGLLKKIYEAQPDVSVLFQSSELVPLPRLLSMITVISLPPVCNKAFFTQGLNFANTAVQLTTFSMMSFILKKVNKNIEFLADHRSDVYTPDTMADLVQQYREMLCKILPDMMSVVSKWQSLSKKDKGEGIQTNKGGSAQQPDQEEQASLLAPDTPEFILLKALILQVVGLYQKVVPYLVTQCKFDFSKLLKGIVSEGGVNEEIAPVLQHQILQLALDLPTSKFSWFRLQEAAADNEKSVLYLLLKMFVGSRCGQLKTSTRMLVVKVLKDSGVFEHTWAELELWLDQLDRVEPSQQEPVIQFLERVFIKLVCHSHTYTDQIASLVQEAAYQQSNLSSQEGDAASVCVSHIDDVLDMLDVIMEGNEGDADEFGPPLSEDVVVQTFPFSVAVPAALEARNKLSPDKGAVFEYLSAVLCHILHSQREPLPLCLGLLQYDKELASSEPPVTAHISVVQLHRYYSKWLPQQCHVELFTSSECQPDKTSSSFTALLKATYLDGLSSVLKDTFGTKVEVAIASMSAADHLLSIKQILLYIKSAVDNFGTFTPNTGSAILKSLMQLLQDLVVKLQSWQVPAEPQPTEQNNRDGSDLFLDVNQSSTVEADKEQMLLSALSSIFKHPCVEQWYLSLELATLPQHSLNSVRLKRVCAQLSDDITTLLKMGAPTLRELGRTELIAPYAGAIQKAVHRELLATSSQTPKSQSRPFQALLSLHGYMDPSKVIDVVSALLLLPQERLVTAQGELSVYGQAALQILTENQNRDDGPLLSQAHLGGLGTLLLSCSSPALEAFLLQMLSVEPGSARLIHTDVLQRCLRRPHRGSLAIADLLISNSPMQRLCFETWCLQPDNLQNMTNMMGNFLPLIKAYLLAAAREDPATPKDVQKTVLKALKKNLLSKLVQSALGDVTQAATVVEALAALIKLSADIADIRDLMDILPDALQKEDSFERWQLVDVITEKLRDCPEEEVTWRKRVTASALKFLIASYGRGKDQAATTPTHEQSVLERLQRLVTSTDDIAAADWNAFVKNGLKCRYNDEHFLNTLRSLSEAMYQPSDIPNGLIPLATIHMMTSSHSLFLPNMLDSDDDDGSSRRQAKEALVSLLLCLVRKCPTVCNMNHFLVLLGAYGATLSDTDQTILLLLQEYEKNNVSLLKFQSIIWGPAALEHHKTRKSLGSSLWKQTHSDDLLALLNADKMLRTITHYPQRRGIIPPTDKVQLFYVKAVKDLSGLYDPCFLLPLFSAILRPESVVDCFKFASSHALGLTLAALSSYDTKVRAAAYHVLSCFYQHLEAARFREKRQLLYLLDMVKNGVRQQNQRLPFVLTTYLSKVAQLMLKPEDYMYVVVNRFLLSHQSLDMRRVPEFFKLFYSFDLEHKTEREWILSVLEEGISDGHCYDICNQQGIFHSLLGFGSGPLCDEHAQAQIVRVLCQAARVTRAAYDLSKSCGLLTWIIQVVEKRNLEQHLLGSIIELLHVLWWTNLGKKETATDGGGTATDGGGTSTLEQESAKCLPLPLINEFLCVALAITRRLRLGVKAAQVGALLRTLSSVLRHRTSASERAERMTLRAQPVASAEALALLLCWSALSGNTALLDHLRNLCEKHKVKELTGGSVTDKTRAKGSQARTGTEKPSEDAETEKRQQSLLAECRESLGSIFMHWRPAFGLGQPQGSECPSQLAVDTAHLLAKCSLRWLVEGSYDEERSRSFLRWLEESVMAHEEIVDELLRDPGPKADLLRLYHRVCQTPTGETFRLFTCVMTGLLERRAAFPEMHRALISACRPKDTQDEAKCEAGLSLLSLYVHEAWGGADTPQLFLSHVDMMIAGRRESAIRAVCRDFAAVKT